MRNLNAHWSDGLTVPNILSSSESEIDQLIRRVGFHTRKANYIIRTARILHSHYADDIPNTIAGLCSLPGVGPKMAYLAMQVAWKSLVGIGVDTHVHRICNRLGWTHSREAEETREQLEEFLPKELWGRSI